MCVSLNPESTSKEQLLELWHHECDWLFGHRMIDNVDIERYQLSYKTVIKKNFSGETLTAHTGESGPSELSILLDHDVHFSNLKETESGIVLAGGIGSSTMNAIGSSVSASGSSATVGSSSSMSPASSSSAPSSSSGGSGSNSSATASGSTTSSATGSSFVTDGYEPHTNLAQIRRLVQTALNEFNKEQQHIVLPLYDAHLSLITRLCHSTQCVGGNCCIVADGGLSPFLVQLVASLMQFTLVYFKASQFVHSRDQFFAQLKVKLVASYYKAGIRVFYDYNILYNDYFVNSYISRARKL